MSKYSINANSGILGIDNVEVGGAGSFEYIFDIEPSLGAGELHDFSWSFWIKLNDLDNNHSGEIFNRYNLGVGLVFPTSYIGTRIHYEYVVGSGLTLYYDFNYVTTLTYNFSYTLSDLSSSWINVIYTYDSSGDTLYLYIDREQKDTLTVNHLHGYASPFNEGDTLNIGNSYGSTYAYLDEICFFRGKNLLDDGTTSINTLYNSGTPLTMTDDIFETLSDEGWYSNVENAPGKYIEGRRYYNSSWADLSSSTVSTLKWKENYPDATGILFQTAYGGYRLENSRVDTKEQSLDFYEPGYTAETTSFIPKWSPLEFAITQCDKFYFLLRRRSNVEGTEFSDIDITKLEISIQDITSGQALTYSLIDANNQSSQYYYSYWDTGTSEKQFILIVDVKKQSMYEEVRVRNININIKDTETDSILNFRVLVDDYDQLFNYITVNNGKVGQRETFSSAGYYAVATLDGNNDSYMLISPFAYLKESDKTDYDFSYPLDSIYYKRQKTYNDENFSFSINSYTHSFLAEHISIKNVPGYSKTCVLFIDKDLYQHIQNLQYSSYVEIKVSGAISDMTDTFKVYFKKDK